MHTRPRLFLAVLLLSCGMGTDPGPGNGGGDPGTGGSTGGTGGSGGATLDSELVSGSRLKAISLHGADGARAPSQAASGLGSAPATFWDSQLMAFCTVSSAAGACVPTRAAVMVDGNYGSYFSDSMCTVPLAIAGNNWDKPAALFPGLSQQDPPVQYAYMLDDNNMLVVYPVTGAFTGTAYRSDPIYGNCTMTGPSSGVLVTLGAIVAPSPFVAFSYAIDG